MNTNTKNKKLVKRISKRTNIKVKGFSKQTKIELKQIFNSVCVLCSKYDDNGEYAHIISLSEKRKGPRHYTKIFGKIEKISAEIIFNHVSYGLYLCHNCHHKIDNSPLDYPVDMLTFKRSLSLLKKHDTVEESRKYNEKKDYIKRLARDIERKINNESVDDDILHIINEGYYVLSFYDWIEVLEIIFIYFETTKEDIYSKLDCICCYFGENFHLKKIYERNIIPRLIEIIKRRYICGIMKDYTSIKELMIFPRLYFVVSDKYKNIIKSELRCLRGITLPKFSEMVNSHITYYLECCYDLKLKKYQKITWYDIYLKYKNEIKEEFIIWSDLRIRNNNKFENSKLSLYL